MTGLAISASGVKKRYGAIDALAGLDLEVPSGAIFGLLGENGAGKTTFIKVLLGIVRANDGDVSVLDAPPGAIEARRRIGYLPENLQLPPALSPTGFLRSAGRLKGMSRAEMDDQIPRLLRQVGLEEKWWNKRVTAFSKGMRQRTGLAAALIGRPELLVLDEPTDGIDPLGRAELREVIRAARDRGATVFLNSHLLAETEKIADHAAVLSRGRVVLAGPLDILRADDRFLVRFADRTNASGEETTTIAARHGFTPDEAAGTWIFAGDGPHELSHALHGALGDGLQVLEVRPLVKDLESVMADAVGRGGA